MSDLRNIRTPLRQQWRRIRYQLLPVLTMGCTLLLTGWLWHRHTAFVDGFGEVRTDQRDAFSQRDGVLVELPGKQVQLGDDVVKGQVVARLDDRPLEKSLMALQAEVERLKLEMEAQAAQFQLDERDRRQDYQAEARRLAAQIESLRLDLLDRQMQLEADKMEASRRQTIYDSLVAAGPGASERERLEAQLLVDVLSEQIKGTEKVIVEAREQLEAARKRAEAHEPLSGDTGKMMAALSAAVTAQQALFDELALQREQLDVRAPLNGTVIMIHRHPGQAVRIGEPVVTIASRESDTIISYIRRDQLPPPRGAVVEVRARRPGARPARSHVEYVGPQVELIPVQQLRDPRMLEWGVPVLIARPSELYLRPGEVVDLRYEDASP